MNIRTRFVILALAGALAAGGCGGAGNPLVVDLGEPRVVGRNDSVSGSVDLYAGFTPDGAPIVPAPVLRVHANIATATTTGEASLPPVTGQYEVVFTDAGNPANVHARTFVNLGAYETGTFTLTGAGTAGSPYGITVSVNSRF
jgi:hypothetical protein